MIVLSKKRRILVGKIDDGECFATSSSFSFFISAIEEGGDSRATKRTRPGLIMVMLGVMKCMRVSG